MSARQIRAAALLALTLYALALLSLGVRKDWRLLHEDNGALHTTLALSHQHLGLTATRAHAVLFNPTTGARLLYGHHPPGPALVLAGAFSLTGSAQPWVARSTVIAFHIASVWFLFWLLRQFFSWRASFVGALLASTLPMSAYFGRAVDYEAFCLPFVLLQLIGWVRWKRKGSRAAFGLLCAGAVVGAWVAWASLFFTAAIVAADLFDRLSRRSATAGVALPLGAVGAGALLLDLAHLRIAGRGDLGPLASALLSNRSSAWETLTRLDFTLGQLENYRLYFTHAGLVASALAALSLIRPQAKLSRHLLHAPDSSQMQRLLAVSGLSALAYCLAAPHWADVHVYWQFYFLPFAVISLLLLLRFLWRRATTTRQWRHRLLLALCVWDVVAVSAYQIRHRHTKPSAYAMRKTAEIRAYYLPPPRPGEETR